MLPLLGKITDARVQGLSLENRHYDAVSNGFSPGYVLEFLKMLKTIVEQNCLQFLTYIQKWKIGRRWRVQKSFIFEKKFKLFKPFFYLCHLRNAKCYIILNIYAHKKAIKKPKYYLFISSLIKT